MEFTGVGNSSESMVRGVGTINGGAYKELNVDGVCNVMGDLEAESLDIDGVCTCTGNITAKELDCDGVLTVSGSLRAGKADIDGFVTVNGSKFEADRIDCDGLLNVEGEISADIIDADGVLNAREIVGDSITIRSFWRNGFWGKLFRLDRTVGVKFSAVDLIEGTTVELRGVKAKSVSGHNVKIGKNCRIDLVEASGDLYIHESAWVGEVAGRETV